MRVKLLFFGEAIAIPSTSIGLGISAVSVWIDGSGYTSASNDIGALGYAIVETPEVDIGEPDDDVKAAFANLHAQTVNVSIKTNLFVKSGGLARVSITRSVQQDGGLVDRTITFQAEDCRGVSVVSNTISFAVEMLEMERPVASLDAVLSEDDVVAIADNAPPADQEQAVA